MKVKDLIAKLQEYDPEHMVVIGGYEGGVNEVCNVFDVKIKLDVYTEWYYGKHEVVHINSAPFDCEGVFIH